MKSNLQKKLGLILKLNKEKLDTIQKEISQILNELDDIEQSIQNLISKAESEEKFASQSIEIGISAQFRIRLKKEINELNHKKDLLKKTYQTKIDELKNIFQEKKSFELYLEKKNVEIQKSEEKEALLHLDEISIQKFMRNK